MVSEPDRCNVTGEAKAVERPSADTTVASTRRNPGGADVGTEGDHRIAMAHLVLGLTAKQPVSVDRAEMIPTSFPTFREAMRGIGAAIEEAA